MSGGADVVKKAFAAVEAGDITAAAALLDENLVFELGGRSRFAGRHEGRAAFFQLQGELGAALEIRNEVVAIHDTENGAIVHQRGTGRDGYQDETLLVFSVREGRVIAVKEFMFDHGPLDAAAPS